ERMSSSSPSPEDDAGANETRARAKAAVTEALRGLSDRERLIVKERMMADEPVTLQKLGEILGVSKERVRQLEERARGKLRSQLATARPKVAMVAKTACRMNASSSEPVMRWNMSTGKYWWNAGRKISCRLYAP